MNKRSTDERRAMEKVVQEEDATMVETRRQHDLLRKERELDEWHREHDLIAGNKFISALRERLPELFTKRSISISAMMKYEQVIKEVILSIGCEPLAVRFADWPVSISYDARMKCDHWCVLLNQDYEGPKTLVPELSPLDELMPD